MDEKLKKIIQESGNNLHTAIAQKLKELGWKLELSTYYNDDTTDKPREIDIIASKDILVTTITRSRTSFKVFLFVECKFFKNDIAFRMYDNNEAESSAAIIRHGFSSDPFDERHGDLMKKHHYVREKSIAKLCDSADGKFVFEALTSSVKSLVFFKEKYNVKGNL